VMRTDRSSGKPQLTVVAVSAMCCRRGRGTGRAGLPVFTMSGPGALGE
jgi:hypothetical protein